jgi:energy-coupling factor transporter ATP-binding protein EcfA2
LQINPDLKAYTLAWFDKLYLCYGPRGMVALAYWLGSLFAVQIRKQFESFPFIEIVGEAGAGKTTLIETLWKLMGRNGYEGFDPLKGSAVGLLRSMAQVSNLPVVLIESDRSDEGDSSRGRIKQSFHWDSLKSLYNGGSLRTTGVKSSGNDTYEPQFRAALVISQNQPVQASTAIMERIVHLYFDKSRQSDAGREAGLALGRMTATEMSGFLIKAVTKEAQVLALMGKRHREYEVKIQQAGVRNPRIQKNHAQLMVFVDALCAVCPISESQRNEAKDLLVRIALEREEALESDHPLVQEFWELYEFIEGHEPGGEDYVPVLNHSRNKNEIAISLPHFEQVCVDRRLKCPLGADLKRVLKTSRLHKFQIIEATNSAVHAAWNARRDVNQASKPSTVKCWVFKA